jgi:RIO-like serine/threonine protein kinase
MASKFLARDVTNIARYFEKKYGVGSEAEIWSKVKVQ